MSELLEYLREKTGCTYLSDLRVPAFRDKAVEVALGLEPGSYPLAQWQEAARYLLDRNGLHTVEQVQEALRNKAPN